MLVKLYQLYTLHIVKFNYFKMFFSNESIEHLCVKKINHNLQYPWTKKKKKRKEILDYNRMNCENMHCLLCLTACFKWMF